MFDLVKRAANQLLANAGNAALKASFGGLVVSGERQNDPISLLGNPLRGYTPEKAAWLLEGSMRGEWTDAQWLFEFVQNLDGDLIALTERRVASVQEIHWEIKPNEELAEKRGLQSLAGEQAQCLLERYERIKNLPDAIGHMASTPLRKYAHLSIGDDELGIIDQWWWLREGMFGRWYYNADLRRHTTKGLQDADYINPAEWIVYEERRSCFWVALIKYLRANNCQKWWDRFCEQCSKNGTVIIAPEAIERERLSEFEAAAMEAARGGSGVLPGGSQVIPTGPQRQGTPPFKDAIAYLREQTVLAATGGLLTMIAVPTGMNDGTSETHENAFRTLRNKSAGSIQSKLQEKLDVPTLAASFPGRPVLAYFQFNLTEDPSPSSYLDDAVKAKQAGFQMDAEELSEKTGYKLTLSPEAAPTPGVGFNRARNRAGRAKNSSAGRISSQPWLDALSTAAINPIAKGRERLLAPLLEQLKGADAGKIPSILYAWSPGEEDAKALADAAQRMAFNATLRGYFNPTGPTPPEMQAPNRLLRAANAGGLDDAIAALFNQPFEEALKFWRAKGLADDLIKATWEQAQAYGFKVSGVQSRDALNALKNKIGEVLQGQKTIDDFVKEATSEYGLNPRHAETVARTNVQSAYQYGHYQSLMDTIDDFPFWGFAVVDDERTSDFCRPLHKLAYPANDPIFDTLYPPNHFNCRTTIQQFTDEQDAKDQGYTIMRHWPRTESGGVFMPAEGFQFNVGTVPSLEALIK